MNELDNLVGEQFGMSADQQYDAFLQEAGITPTVVDEAIAKQNKEIEDRRKARLEKALSIQKEVAGPRDTVLNALDIASGVGVSARNIAKFTYNGIVDVADRLENIAAEYGLGTGDVISDANKWDDPVGAEAEKTLGTPGKVAKVIYDIAAPLSLGLGVGAKLGSTAAGVAGGITLDGVYSFLAQDPNAPNIVDIAKGTDFEDLPIISDLMTTTYDTEMEGRVKNAVISMGLGAATVGLFSTGMKVMDVYKGRKAVQTAVASEELSTVLNNVDEVAPPTTATPITEAVENTPQTPKPLFTYADNSTPEAIAAEEASLQAFETGAVKVEFYNRGIKTLDDGTPAAPLFDTPKQYSINEAVASLPDDARRIIYTPITDAELTQIAKAHMDDPKIVDRLVNWKQGDPTPDDVQTLILKSLVHNKFNEVNKVAQNFNPDDPATVLALIEAKKVSEHLSLVGLGTASRQGAAFRVHQLPPIIAGTTPQNFMQRLGVEGRAKLISKAVNQAGGMDNLKKLAEQLKVISQIPDRNFTLSMGEVIEKTKYMKFEEAVTKVAINGMLSSPGTLLKAVVGNSTMMAKTILEDYYAVVRPGMDMKLSEANARVMGIWASLADGYRHGIDAFNNPNASANALRLDIPPGTLLDSTDKAQMMSLNFAEKVGVTLALKEAPVRALIGMDAFFQHIIAQGEINQAILRGAQDIPPGQMAEYLATARNSLDPAVIQRADNLAKSTTLAKELSPRVQAVVDTFNKYTEWVPFHKVLVPFVRTNINAIEQVIENSPFARIVPMTASDFRSIDPLVRQRAILKAETGTLALVTLTGFAFMDSLQGMMTPTEKKLSDRNATPETSIKVNGKWVDVKSVPVVGPLTNIAAFIAKASGHLSDQQMEEVVTGLKLVVAETMTPDTLAEFTSGFYHLILGDTEKGMQWLTTVPTRFVPASGLLRDAKQLQDPYVRVQRVDTNKAFEDFYKTVVNRYKAIIPGLSEELPAMQNRYGEYLKLPAGIGPDVVTPITYTDGKYKEHTDALINLINYKKVNSLVDAPDLSLIDVPKVIDAYISVPTPIFDAIVPQGYKYRLTPLQHEYYKRYFGGYDPDTGKPLEGGTLRENEARILQKYSLYGKDPAEITPDTYRSVVAELHKLQSDFRRRADTLIRVQPDVKRDMAEQVLKVQEFNNLQGIQ